MGKFEYLTGKDLGYEPGVVEQIKFELSQLDKVFNKGIEKMIKKKDFWKDSKILNTKIKSS